MENHKERRERLLRLHSGGASITDIAKAEGVSVTRVRQILSKATMEANRKPMGYDGALSVRTINCLKSEGVPEDDNGNFDLSWIAKNLTQADLLRINNFGRKSLNELLAYMSERGFPLIPWNERDRINDLHQNPRLAARTVRLALSYHPPLPGESLEAWLARLDQMLPSWALSPPLTNNR